MTHAGRPPRVRSDPRPEPEPGVGHLPASAHLPRWVTCGYAGDRRSFALRNARARTNGRTRFRQNPNTISSHVGVQIVSRNRHGNDADMAHVVTLKTDPRDTTVVYLSTPLDMANTMGGFGPARYVGANAPIPGVSYVIPRDDLPRFRSYAQHHGVSIVDAGVPARAPRPPWSEAPLPECTHCGQPARRGARLEHCPNCGSPWQAVEVGTHHPDHDTGPRAKCTACDRYTPMGYTHCTHCGASRADA